MEARLNKMKLAELHSLSNKKLLGVKIDDKKVKLPKAQLIANILKSKTEAEIDAALVKYQRTPSEYPPTELTEEGADIDTLDDAAGTLSPAKVLVQKALNAKKEKILNIVRQKILKTASTKANQQKLATDKSGETKKALMAEGFEKFKQNADFKKMKKRELIELLKVAEFQEENVHLDEMKSRNAILESADDSKKRVGLSATEKQQRSFLLNKHEDDEFEAIKGNKRREKDSIEKIAKTRFEEQVPIVRTAPPPTAKTVTVTPVAPIEFEDEKANEIQYKKITKKNVGDIDLKTKVEDTNVHVKPNVKISDIQRGFQKQKNRLKLTMPRKIVYHKLNSIGKEALNNV